MTTTSNDQIEAELDALRARLADIAQAEVARAERVRAEMFPADDDRDAW